MCYTKRAMKVIILYRPNSEHGRVVETYISDFQRRHPSEHLEVLSIDSRDGSAMASLYDVMQYPSILVLQSDGSLHKCWQGSQLPLMEEVVAYARN